MTEANLPLFCANHPGVETSLRCNKCEKPICAKCAVLTPTGYRCKECVRGQQKIFVTAEWYDYLLAFFVAGTISFLGSLLVSLVSFLGFFGLFTFLIAPAAAMAAAESVRFATRKHHGKSLFLTAAAGALLGSLPLALGSLLPFLGMLFGGGGLSSLGALYPVIWHVVYAVIVTSTTYYRLAGIRIQ